MKRVPTYLTIGRSAWQLFVGWTGLDVDLDDVPADERWSFVLVTVPAVIRARNLRPMRTWILTQSPAWLVAVRLQRRTHHWYRVPSRAAAEHAELKFDFWPIGVGDHLRIMRGRLTAIGCAGKNFSEIIFVQPNGEPEPDPQSPEMSKAWAAYWEPS